MDKNELLARVDHLLLMGKDVMATHAYSDFTGNVVNSGKQMGFRTASLSFIKNLYGESHIYFKDFDQRVKGNKTHEADAGVNILLSIRHEIDQDWLTSIQQLVSAEIFSDFLEMSRYLLDNKYKDPAAVVIGSILEEHLRFLGKNHGVDLTLTKGSDIIPKKAEQLNADLLKAAIYTVLEQKSVTAWLDLRNRAAHGKYTEYSHDQVEIMYLGVLNFITTVS